VEVMK